jgi:hypothetical protein
MYVYKLGQNCFDIRSLVEHINYESSQRKRVTNPFNREIIKAEDLDNIVRRFNEVNLLIDKNRAFFDHIYILLYSIKELPHGYDTLQYWSLRRQFTEAGSPNPFNYFNHNCDSMIEREIGDDVYRDICNEEMAKLLELYNST